MTTRTFFRSTVLALGALVAFATPSFADGPNRGPRGDRQGESHRNDRDRDGRDDRGQGWNNGGNRGHNDGYRNDYRHGAGWTSPNRIWATPVVTPRPIRRIPTGMLVISNPFDFRVNVFVNGQSVGRVGAFGQLRIPGVHAGSATVTFQRRNRVLLSEQVWVRADYRNSWRPRAPRPGVYATRW